jgi:SAM-dependent methyltransferase
MNVRPDTAAGRHIKVPVHTAFYRWAADWVTDRAVLDVGCGEGYGTAILAEKARSVTGLDLDSDQLEVTRQTYCPPNVEYLVGDAEDTGLGSETFEVVITNALLEYLTDCEKFFDEAERLLKPGGIFLCSTKNATFSIKKSDGTPLYSNHNQEFTPAELERSLAKRFPKVEMYGLLAKDRSEKFILDKRALRMEAFLVRLNVKHLIPLSWRNFIRSRLTGIPEEAIVADDFEISRENVDKSFYVIGVGFKK